MLRTVRSIKNTFAPINQVPPEIFSLIPDHCEAGEDLIRLTHVCHGWREILISRASLWTYLDCKNPNKTGTYIQRSRGSPLEVSLVARGPTPLPKDALLLVLQHISRFKALTLYGTSLTIPNLVKHFNSPAPLLEKLDIRVLSLESAAVKGTIFGGNLSSLRELRLWGVLTNLPWKNMSNLTILDFHGGSGDNISATQLLDFFEHAPLLRDIRLVDTLPDSSNVPAERAVSLLHLVLLKISAEPVHSILLNHLHIPTGALVTMEFEFDGERSPILDYLPGSLDNLKNISHVTSINLAFDSGVAMRVNGPSGGLYMISAWGGSGNPPPMLDHHILRSLNKLPTSTTERLVVTQYYASAHPKTEDSGAYQVLLPMNDLRALTLTDCNNTSFLHALNPSRNTSNTVACPKLEELTLNIPGQRDESRMYGLLEMTMERASRGAKLSSILICQRESLSAKELSDLRSYACHVEYRFDYTPPRWDILPGEPDEAGYESDW